MPIKIELFKYWVLVDFIDTVLCDNKPFQNMLKSHSFHIFIGVVNIHHTCKTESLVAEFSWYTNIQVAFMLDIPGYFNLSLNLGKISLLII